MSAELPEAVLANYSEAPQQIEVHVARRTLAGVFLRGQGVEVGAGTRPWPLPRSASCFYGDARTAQELEGYFARSGSALDGHLDAQTFAGVQDGVYDFALSAHVIEHLVDPIGGIAAMLRVIRPGGIAMFAIPDKRYTWDNPRPLTPLEHLIDDYRTGGDATRIDACLEHIRFLHPQWAEAIPAHDQIAKARLLAEGRGNAHFDTHYHTWNTSSFIQMLDWICINLPATILHTELVVNENIGVLQRKDHS